MAQQALDTFVAEVDGAPVLVQKGRVFADNDPVVKVDAGRGHLFRQLDYDEQAPKKRGRPAKAAAAGEENGDG